MDFWLGKGRHEKPLEEDSLGMQRGHLERGVSS
jgi:hypothetical protein